MSFDGFMVISCQIGFSRLSFWKSINFEDLAYVVKIRMNEVEKDKAYFCWNKLYFRGEEYDATQEIEKVKVKS